MKSRTPIAVTALLALALAGCADPATDTAAGASGSAGAPSATAGASTSAGPGASVSAGSGQNVGDTLLVFTRTGGLAGTNDKLTVKPDGSWALQSKGGAKEGKLTPVELTTLKAGLEQVGFSKLPKVNKGGNVADGYTYAITYGGDEITAEDGAVPPALQPVVTTLNGLLSK